VTIAAIGAANRGWRGSTDRFGVEPEDLDFMVEETARHVGHLDTMRELLDGNKGYY